MSKLMDISTLVEYAEIDLEEARSVLIEATRYFEHTDELSRNYLLSSADHIRNLLHVTLSLMSGAISKLDESAEECVKEATA